MINRCSQVAICAVVLGPLVNGATTELEAAGSAGSTVTGVTELRDGYPDISPDGVRIVFQSNRTGTWQLWIVNIDGTGLLRLTHTGANDTSPVWSPDGTEIMFASDRAGGESRDLDPSESYSVRDFNCPSNDPFNNARIELACLRMAESAGIEVARGRIVSGISGQQVLLLDRFDVALQQDRYHLITVNGLL